MSLITIQFNDDAVQASLKRLMRNTSNLEPALARIGESLVHSTKQRFETSTAPDGSKWKPNSEVTLMRYLNARGGLTGKKAANVRAHKKPLIGASKSLSTQIFYQVDSSTLRVGSPMIYAATQQFGARQGQFGRSKKNHPIPWGTIPPRPFLGISEQDKINLLAILASHIERSWR